MNYRFLCFSQINFRHNIFDSLSNDTPPVTLVIMNNKVRFVMIICLIYVDLWDCRNPQILVVTFYRCSSAAERLKRRLLPFLLVQQGNGPSTNEHHSVIEHVVGFG